MSHPKRRSPPSSANATSRAASQRQVRHSGSAAAQDWPQLSVLRHLIRNSRHPWAFSIVVVKQANKARSQAFTAACSGTMATYGSFGQAIAAKRQMELVMDWNRVEGNWKQLKGKVKEKWGKLSDDDLSQNRGQARSVGRQDPGAVWRAEGSGEKARGRVGSGTLLAVRCRRRRPRLGRFA